MLFREHVNENESGTGPNRLAHPKVTHSGLLSVMPEAVIDKNSPVPLHHQLELFLRQGIENGLFPPQEMLPTEQEIQAYFGLSRTPIRQALAKLSADGLVLRRRSLGTIVLPKPFEENLRSLNTFTQEVQSKGHRPGAKLLEFTIKSADQEDIKQLKLKEAAEIYHIRRVRFIDDEPVGEIVSHIPVAIVPNLEATDFTEQGPAQSIYNVLETVHGVKLVRAVETFRAVSLNPESAKLLNVAPYSAVLLRSRTTFDTSGRAVALEHGLYRGLYRLEWQGRELSSFDASALT